MSQRSALLYGFIIPDFDMFSTLGSGIVIPKVYTIIWALKFSSGPPAATVCFSCEFTVTSKMQIQINTTSKCIESITHLKQTVKRQYPSTQAIHLLSKCPKLLCLLSPERCFVQLDRVKLGDWYYHILFTTSHTWTPSSPFLMLN